MEQREDARHGATRRIQKDLLQLSYFDPRIPSVPIDGIFGDATRRAVCAYQRSAGLPVTGEVDLGTWNALRASATASAEAHAAPLPLTVFPRFPDGGEIGPGEESRTVALIQFLLSELAVVCGSGQGPALTGIYDGNTEGSVRRFQAVHGLPPTGRVDKITWDRLATALTRVGSQ